MSEFELVFSLLSLLLGLAIAQVLSDAGRVVARRKAIRIGWLTPLLAIFVLIDLSSFWTAAFDMRQVIAANLFVLLILLIVCGAYYLAATLVVSDPLEDGADLDHAYWANRRIVLGAVAFANAIAAASDVWTGRMISAGLVLYAVFFGLLLAAMVSTSKRANLIWLASLCAFYLFLAVGSAGFLNA